MYEEGEKRKGKGKKKKKRSAAPPPPPRSGTFSCFVCVWWWGGGEGPGRLIIGPTFGKRAKKAFWAKGKDPRLVLLPYRHNIDT